MAGDPLAAAREPSPSVVVACTVAGAPSMAVRAASIAARCRRQARPLAHDHRVGVDHAQAGLAAPARITTDEHPLARDAGPLRRRRGEERADVRLPGRRQQGVAERVGHDVAVGVAHQALGVVDRDRPEHQRAPRAEPVRVEPAADPHAHRSGTCCGSPPREAGDRLVAGAAQGGDGGRVVARHVLGRVGVARERDRHARPPEPRQQAGLRVELAAPACAARPRSTRWRRPWPRSRRRPSSRRPSSARGHAARRRPSAGRGGPSRRRGPTRPRPPARPGSASQTVGGRPPVQSGSSGLSIARPPSQWTDPSTMSKGRPSRKAAISARAVGRASPSRRPAAPAGPPPARPRRPRSRRRRPRSPPRRQQGSSSHSRACGEAVDVLGDGDLDDRPRAGARHVAADPAVREVPALAPPSPGPPGSRARRAVGLQVHVVVGQHARGPEARRDPAAPPPRPGRPAS